jgi:hypothetical protein
MYDPFVIITVLVMRSGAHYPFTNVPMRAASPLSKTLQLEGD